MDPATPRQPLAEELLRSIESLRFGPLWLTLALAASIFALFVLWCESVSEWTFDTSTLVRFAALALLASGSWLGGALVERLLDVALE